MIETTGEGKSAVATPDGKSRKKKNILNISMTLLVYRSNELTKC